jgi:dTDP-4-dehydrorhamnose 3,5-epimerase
MKIIPTPIDGLCVVEFDKLSDDRGFFARSYCAKEFEAAGLEPAVAQCNVSFNHVAGTLRGFHLQTADAPEAKLVRCTRGAIVDVVVDMRPSSPTLGETFSVELTDENHRSLFLPPLFAHAYQTLADATEVHYQVSHPYTPNTERGIRHDDPVIGFEWPHAVTVVSDKDREWPLLGSPEGLAELARVSGTPS